MEHGAFRVTDGRVEETRMKCEICTIEFDRKDMEMNMCKSCDTAVHNKWLMEGGIDAYTRWKRFQAGLEGDIYVKDKAKEQHAVLDEAYADGREGGEG